jgi:DNA polymerase I-like protein with 3'-5' exonuclease and polymerase domains
MSGSPLAASAEREQGTRGGGESVYFLQPSIHFPAGYTAVDTEGTPTRPWCLSASADPATGIVVRAGGAITADPDAQFILHNALWDLPVLKALGLDVRDGQFTDTMLMAWLLGFEFIGLKKLAGLLLGKDRDSYKDVMEVASERIGRQWLVDTLDEFPRWPGAKPPEMEKTLRLIDRMLAKDGGERTLRERWNDCRAREVLQDDLRIVGDMPEATLDDVPLDEAVAYAGEDAVDTRRLHPILDRRIDEMGLRDVLNVDLAVVPMICRMHEVGIKAEPQHFRDLSNVYADECAQLAKDIQAMGGPENPGSGPDVAEWLFGTLRLPCRKKTKGGERSTDKKALEALIKNPKIVGVQRQGLELLMEWRQVKKLKTTYADPMPDFIAADGRLHPNISMTTVPTGRLAAKRPNVLAFPKHSERGKLIRAGFVADEGCELGEWDLSQIELRILAIDSGDERMLAEFNSGVDKHTSTAAMIFSRTVEDLQAAVDAKDKTAKEQRFAAKAVNFGIAMGITEYGLLDQFLKQGSIKETKRIWNQVRETWEERALPWTLEDCAELLAMWHRGYPQASAYLYGKQAEARRYGYVRDMWDRLRYIEDINADNNYFKDAALREAQATPIQSGAQGLVKRWMRAVWKRLPALWAQGIRVECLLQVHDALLMEYELGAREAVNAMLQDALDELQWFPISITMDGSFGQRWSEL